MTLPPDPVSAPQTATHFAVGPHVAVFQPSAGVQVRGDTLLIVGAARSPCSESEVTAFRTGMELNVQLQPREWRPLDCTVTQAMQPFEARYTPPKGNTIVHVTGAVGFPATLFSGAVHIF